MTLKISAVDDYILGFDHKIQERLFQIRDLIHDLAPEAQEYLFYKVPSIALHPSIKAKDGLMFAAFKNHISLYPKPEVIKHFEDKISELNLKSAEGTIQFALNKPLPVDFIREIILYKLAHE